MRDSEIARLMAEAAARATEACLAKGYGRADAVTRKSAFAAAEEVRRRLMPEESETAAVSGDAPEDGWSDRADVTG